MNLHSNKTSYLFRRVLCALLAFLFMLIMLYFMAYESSHAVHDCTGEECPICQELHIAQSITQHAGNLGVLTAAVFFAVVVITRMMTVSGDFLVNRTPVLDKVRLDD